LPRPLHERAGRAGIADACGQVDPFSGLEQIESRQAGMRDERQRHHMATGGGAAGVVKHPRRFTARDLLQGGVEAGLECRLLLLLMHQARL